MKQHSRQIEPDALQQLVEDEPAVDVGLGEVRDAWTNGLTKALT